MTGKIDAYIDCGTDFIQLRADLCATAANKWLVSPYSYYAALYLRRNRKALESHGVEVELVYFTYLEIQLNR